MVNESRIFTIYRLAFTIKNYAFCGRKNFPERTAKGVFRSTGAEGFS
jgi:hypothetical protein